MKLNFEWDFDKAKANLKKHGVSFDEATTVFIEPFSMTKYDPDHSVDEQRYIDIGRVGGGLYRTRRKYTYYQLPQSNPF
jgi:hypothetical protein